MFRCANYNSIYIDIIHEYNKNDVDFTANNFQIQKINNEWKLNTRVEKIDTVSCILDAYYKKINFVKSTVKQCDYSFTREKIHSTKMFARAAKLLAKGFTYSDCMIDNVHIDPSMYKDSFAGKDAVCTKCGLEIQDGKDLRLSCGHAYHIGCILKMIIKYPKTDMSGYWDRTYTDYIKCTECDKKTYMKLRKSLTI